MSKQIFWAVVKRGRVVSGQTANSIGDVPEIYLRRTDANISANWEENSGETVARVEVRVIKEVGHGKKKG